MAQMALLADATRREHAQHAPTFHRPAPDALDVHQPWLARLVEDPDVGTFVADDSDGSLSGFVVITLVPAPPVYDPGGSSSLIDDFCVAAPELWPSVGADLLSSATEWARCRGAVQVVVVCGPHDTAKRELLARDGLVVASEWFTRPLASGP